MLKKGVWTLVCVLVILGFGIADGYGKNAKKCQKTEAAAADVNSTKTCCVKNATDANTPADPNSEDTGVISSLMKKCGLKKTCCKKQCNADCKKTCCDKKVADANSADPNSKDTGFIDSLKKKCGLNKKACCDKTVADANSTDPNDAGMINNMMKKCGLKKGCCKKPADANCPAVK